MYIPASACDPVVTASLPDVEWFEALKYPLAHFDVGVPGSELSV